MPGPFESKTHTGTFEKDISCIQQNDIWSSETFNNFVGTVYQLFYTESAYDHIFRNAGPGVQARLLQEKPQTSDGSDGESMSVPVLRFTDMAAESPSYISVGTADGSDFNSLHLVYGNGDLSRSIQSYAMVRILPEPTSTVSEGYTQYDTTSNSNYCIIRSLYNLGGAGSPNRRFHDLSEFVLRYDRSIPVGDTTITAACGDKLIKGYEVPVKYTFTFGKSATLNNFTECVEGLRYHAPADDPAGGFQLYRAQLVGQAVAANIALWQALGFDETGSAAVTSKVIRFVPVRPAVSFAEWNSAAGNLSKLLVYTKPDGRPNADAVFKYTGIYGFMLDNYLSAPVVQKAGSPSDGNVPLIYIPNKNNYHHYEPLDGSGTPYPLPGWYEALTDAGVSLGTTQNFSADYFFLPLLAVYEKYLEFAGMTVSLETLLDRGETDIAVVPGAADTTDLESEIRYDSYRFTGETAPSVDVRKPLVDAADNVFEAFKPSLNAFEDGTSVPRLGRGVFAGQSMLKTESNAMALDRTLQVVVGLDWKLSNIIWIDPLLGNADGNTQAAMCDRQRKMYASVALAVLDDAKFGRGSLITPTTVFIHITDHQSDAPAYSNDPADGSYQNAGSAYRRNMWREIYSEYLPAGCRHIALRAVDGAKVTETGFRLDHDRGPAPLYIRLLQDPGLTYDGNGVYSSVDVPGAPGIKHLHCEYVLTGEDKDLDTDYYPLRGQDFSLTSGVIIDDPEAGMRVVEKLTDARIILEGVKADTLSYVPRTHGFLPDSGYYSQRVGVHEGGNGQNDPSYALNPSGGSSWRPDYWQDRGLLDWYLYDGEVCFRKCAVRILNQNIELGDSPSVKGVCISRLNINSRSVLEAVSCRLGAAQPEPEDGLRITVPAAGRLTLWRSGDYTCTAEVSELNPCGNGGSQIIDYAPVAWPFSARYVTPESEVVYINDPSEMAGRYSVDPDTGEVTKHVSVDCLCRLGAPDPSDTRDSAKITGGSIDLALRIEDRSEATLDSGTGKYLPQDCETRARDGVYRQNFFRFIKLDRPVTGCKLTIRIDDTGNRHDWYPPNSDPEDQNAPHYSPGTWQAFDPDLFLPLAPWVQTGGEGERDWPSNFAFIEGDSRGVSHQAEPQVFSQCGILINQERDAVYWMPEGGVAQPSTNPTRVFKRLDYMPCAMFFASRIFRRSSYIFYLAGVNPSVVTLNPDKPGEIQCSDAVNLAFAPGYASATPEVFVESRTAKRAAKTVLWRPDPEETESPATESPAVAAHYFTYKTNTFVSGLESSRIDLPELKVITVTRKTANWAKQISAKQPLPRLSDGTGIALFSCVSGSTVMIGRLDTRYPLVDEWKYIADAYPSLSQLSGDDSANAAYWAEPSNGFLFFTYPEYLDAIENVPARVNRDNDIKIGIWSTRTLLSGIHGLQGSSFSAMYDFNTQHNDLMLFSLLFSDYWLQWIGNIPTNMETRSGSRYYTAERPRYWTQIFSDPGAALKVSSNNPLLTLSYLPCLPLVYLSEVQDCTVNLGLTSLAGHPRINSYDDGQWNDFGAQSLPCNTVNMNDPNRRSLRVYMNNLLTTQRPVLPHAGPADAGQTPSLSLNIRRTLRLALGFQVQRSDGARFLTSASCNNITGVFTRANIVAGMYNHVSGWCYELVPVKHVDSQSEDQVYNAIVYYYNTDNSDDNYAYPPTDDPDSYYLGPSLLDDNSRDLKAARRLLTLDIAVPLGKTGCPENETDIYEIMALQQWKDPEASSNDSLQHMATGICDTLKPKLAPQQGPRLTTASCPIVDYYHYLSASDNIPLISGGFLSATDAYNTADLRTILLPTHDVDYYTGSPMTVPEFRPLHTVCSLGDTEEERLAARSAYTEAWNMLGASVPGLVGDVRKEIARALVDAGHVQAGSSTVELSLADMSGLNVTANALAELDTLADQQDSNVVSVLSQTGKTGYRFTLSGLSEATAFTGWRTERTAHMSFPGQQDN